MCQEKEVCFLCFQDLAAQFTSTHTLKYSVTVSFRLGPHIVLIVGIHFLCPIDGMEWLVADTAELLNVSSCVLHPVMVGFQLRED
jgi:hypothetical protein